MSEYIEVIGQLKPKNNGVFPIADVNDLKGGYIQVDTIAEMEGFLGTNKLKEGMLCYVKNPPSDIHMFQYIGAAWTPWIVSGGGGGGMSLVVVEYLSDLENVDLKLSGQIVYINEVEELRFYNGTTWNSFSRIYIQNTPPDDKGGIWIDTSEDKQFLNSNQVIQNLLQVISVLQEKVSKLEWAFKSQMDFGTFTNNQYYEYNHTPAVEPTYGTDEESDVATQTENLLTTTIEDIEPTDSATMIPNGTHLCIKSGTYAEMLVNKDDFLPKELLWCWDTKQLWIKDPRTLNLINIGSTTSPIDDETMEQILTEVIGTGEAAKTKIIGIEFADMNDKNNTYLVRVKDGKLDVYDYRLDKSTLAGNAQIPVSGDYYKNPYFPITPDLVGSQDSPKIYINMVYTGGDGGKYDYNYSSHNFVELVNLGLTDLNLKGLYLHYTERKSGRWVSLPLKGILKSQGTFLIRGAQCSVRDINTTLLKIDSYDLEWTKAITYNSDTLEVATDIEAGVEAHSIWDSDNYIKFSTACSFYISGENSEDFYKTNVLQTTAPFNAGTCLKWYIDLFGVGSYDGTSMPSESTALATLGTKYLHLRYYHMDPVAQATKALSARKNSADWISIDLSNIPPEYNIEDFTPKGSLGDKNIFFNKNLLQEGAPEIITCSFGHNAHTTRCFNWMSVGYYDEYIQIIPDGEEYTETLGVDMFESFKAGDQRDNSKNWGDPIYDRIREVSTDGTAFTVHKFIKDFTEPTLGSTQVYKYKVGRANNWSEERSFTLRNRQDVINNGFKFLQVTDEQGFTQEEYEVVDITSKFILQDKVTNNYDFDFIYNSGDIAQNGNRFNEWINYFKNRKSLLVDKELMFVVGNNDLCPTDVHNLGIGDESSKLNPINVTYFFTFEHPFEVPKTTTGNYIPSLYSFVYGDTYFLGMNSEIPTLAITEVYKEALGINLYTDTIFNWCTNDLLNHALDANIYWKISVLHEAPFTIITANSVLEYTASPSTTARGGSRVNTVGNYWYSKFLQDNEFSLCLCGHKHTYAESRYLREDITPGKTMNPIIYEPSLDLANWYINTPQREKALCQLSNNSSQWYVKYVMNQATGYKLGSNKELPAKNIPWLKEYYPVATQVENTTTNTATVTPNPEQTFPHYIVWDIGAGLETSNPATNLEVSRRRIKGNVYKIKKVSGGTGAWPAFRYASRITLNNLERAGGNGVVNPTYNVIIDKSFNS